MIKSVFVLFAAVALTCTVFAQKPMKVASWEDLATQKTLDNSNSRFIALLIEYFRAEMAAMSKLKNCDAIETGKVIVKQHKAEGAFTPAEIKKICADPALKASYLVLFRLESLNRDGMFDAIATVYDANGNKKNEFKESVKGIKLTDVAAQNLARRIAVSVRGVCEVDKLISIASDETEHAVDNMKSSNCTTERKYNY